MDIVVRGRHMEVSERFRDHAASKLAKVERYDGKCHRIDVEVSKESNPRLADHAIRVELTCHGKGPVIRAEATAGEKYAALDVALGRLEERLRRAADRRHDHHRAHSRGGAKGHIDEPVPVGDVTALLNGQPTAGLDAGLDSGLESGLDNELDAVLSTGPLTVQGDGPLVVREKIHGAAPMTLDQALYEMELVGHDFFLFFDSTTSTPSVVYRRKGYDYGVIHLELSAVS